VVISGNFSEIAISKCKKITTKKTRNASLHTGGNLVEKTDLFSRKDTTSEKKEETFFLF
jgi:hypothetical protein